MVIGPVCADAYFAIKVIVKLAVVNDAVSSGIDNMVTAEFSLNDTDFTGGASLAILADAFLDLGTKVGPADYKCAHAIVY